MTVLRLVIAVLAACIVFGQSQVAHGGHFRVGTWKTAQTIQPFFYRDHLAAGDTVEVFAFTNPADQKTALLAGSLDMTGTTVAHAIQSAVMGQPVVVVAALCHKASALVVRSDGPVRIIADLRGKRIGYVPGTMHEILLRETLEAAGLSPTQDVTLVRIDFFDMATALAQGAIDAFLSGEPFPSVAVAQGYGRILSYPYYDGAVGTINAALLVTRAMIERQPAAVQRLVNAHAGATEALRQDRDRWLARAESFGTPRAVLDQAAGNIELAWAIDAEFIGRARALGKRMQALGIIDRQPDYDKLFDLRFVGSVDLRPRSEQVRGGGEGR
ncbi:ABC transporter substrate-binding protein [Desulfoprunum benzoelyticum]|uniref:NitT/TauT family transport system substrate-binding protein n=1 Tax=Desulfoprunum benzoelyticum TaxID=1506996 RepID=A0A840UQF6_9BACT|nr:ABC transporter substrate-binding protein [Desulfoprunum benzoelyticum]MBB5348022.1 NitT/TauT family transport system substrate-binding protein [Desulfoprunum benzoelyticum]MBM9531438.1 ABC transporter substrate-binding protein [Desulfoprunum benzoelyticum]